MLVNKAFDTVRSDPKAPELTQKRRGGNDPRSLRHYNGYSGFHDGYREIHH
jgi:hypothetical protein